MSNFRSSGELDDALVDLGDAGFWALNMRAEAEQLVAGEVAISENGRMERRSWQPRKALLNLSGALQVDGDPLRLPFFLIDEPGGLPIDVSAERSEESVVLTFSNAPAMVEGDAAWLGVSGLTGTVDPNGQRFMTVQSSPGGGDLVLAFTIPGATGSESYGGSGLVANYLDDSAAAAIWGSCVYSDPSSENSESIIEAATGVAFRVDTGDGSVTEIPYPVGEMLSGPVELEQAFDRVFLWQDGKRSWEWIPPASDFTLVPGGDYEQPQVFEVTGAAVEVVSGLATITVVGNTTIEEGDMVRIYSTNSPFFLDFVEREFKATAASATEVSFYIPVPDLATIGTDVLSIGKQVSIGLGFSYMPAPPWGVYHQRRLWVPYRYWVGEDGGDPTYTARNVSDEMVASDILDPHTYDTAINQFRITAGVADFIVAFHPFADDILLVLMRNSLHAVYGVSGALADTSTRELTKEIGCLARKSVAQYGSQVLFLADNGVYAVGFFDEYNLRPVGEPLSAPIQPLIDRINPDLAGDSIGEYFNNRYWLAVPLDSEPGANDATGNNAILVYNVLNQAWESVDTVGDSRWEIQNLLISRAGERNDLYVVNTLGGVHRIDAADSDSDRLALVPGEVIEEVRVPSRFRSRQYEGGTADRKRFSRVQGMFESSGQACDAELLFITEDPDNSVTLQPLSATIGGPLSPSNSCSSRFRVGGFRGQGASLEITPRFGRPKLKGLAVEATTTNRSTISQK